MIGTQIKSEKWDLSQLICLGLTYLFEAQIEETLLFDKNLSNVTERAEF